MTPGSLILTIIAGGIAVGSLTAAAVPTAMKPAPEQAWEKRLQPRPVTTEATYRFVERGPFDLSPDVEFSTSAELPQDDSRGNMPVGSYESNSYANLHYGPVTPDPTASVKVSSGYSRSDRTAKAASAAQRTALDVAEALQDPAANNAPEPML